MARRKKKREADAAGFEEKASAPGSRSRLTPIDIQQKVFRLAFRGYNERDVDEFLDLVTEDVAALHEENKRLREQAQNGGGAGQTVTDAERQAEAIVREAREHAARLVEDAERRAEAPGPSGVVTGISASFLIREREFLQRLASLVQSHAKGLKEEARKAKSAAPSSEVAATTAAAGAAVAPPEPAGAAVDSPSLMEPQPVPAEMIESSAEPPPPSPVAPPPEEDATAPWGPVAEEPGEVSGEAPSAAWAEPQPEEGQDPLLSAWESAFLAGPEAQGAESPREPSLGGYEEKPGERKDEDKGNEPSLRELFWGEE